MSEAEAELKALIDLSREAQLSHDRKEVIGREYLISDHKCLHAHIHHPAIL